jgi:putative membrane protein
MSIALTLLKVIFAQWRGYGGHMGPGMMGWGYGTGWVGMILMAAFWIAVIVGIIFLIRWVVISTVTGGRGARSEESALEILKRRYARGEINKEEFEEKKKDLA